MVSKGVRELLWSHLEGNGRVSHPVFRRIPSANYMCAQNVHTTHIATNMKNIKNNALLYIEHSYNKTYNYYKSIAKTILNLLSSGLHTPQGWLTRGSTHLVLMDSTRNCSLDPPSGTHLEFFCW
jgi:hypothetical protein